jgi:hypothetical protein
VFVNDDALDDLKDAAHRPSGVSPHHITSCQVEKSSHLMFIAKMMTLLTGAGVDPPNPTSKISALEFMVSMYGAG